MGKELDLAQQEHGATAFRQLGDGPLELRQFLPGHDLPDPLSVR